MDIDIKATNVIICDDIRREPSGKEMLIGVYAGSVVFPLLPARLPCFSVRIEFKTGLKSADDLTVELRDPEGNAVFSITGYMEMIGQDGVQVLSVVCNQVEFKIPGVHTLFFGTSAWLEPIYSFPVKIDALNFKKQDS